MSQTRAAGSLTGADRGDPSIDGSDFVRFCDMFYRSTGIVFGESKRYFVDRRLTDRLLATRCGSVTEYLMLLRLRDPHGLEMQHIINAMTVNETYFYREDYQFRCLVNSILPELTTGRSRSLPLQIWSMPCSTGEEPYSIALHLLEDWPAVDDWDIRLLATDIDTRVLDHARAGIYDARSLQHVPPRTRTRFFEPADAGRWRIMSELRESVEFIQANVTLPADLRTFRDIDIIFCRNMLIYFDDISRRQAIEAFFDALRPGGFICLGHSESMSRISSLFTIRKFQDAIVYQKPKAADHAGKARP